MGCHIWEIIKDQQSAEVQDKHDPFSSLIHAIVKIIDNGLNFYFHFHFLFYFNFIFLFLEQLGLGVISHAVTSVTTW